LKARIVEWKYFALCFDRTLIGKDYNPGEVVLAAIPIHDSDVDLRLLHTSSANGRYSLAILANLEKFDVASGSGNYPVLLAGIDWKSDSKPLLENKPWELHFHQHLGISSLTSSSCTAREWGRTAKNGDWVHSLVDGRCKPLAIRAVKATKGFGKTSHVLFTTEKDSEHCLVSSLADSRQPLHVQRHLVGVLTKRSGGRGKQFDLFRAAAMLNGKYAAIEREAEFWLAGAGRGPQNSEGDFADSPRPLGLKIRSRR
jgi:hypothetical protein